MRVNGVPQEEEMSDQQKQLLKKRLRQLRA
jgi:hypothetical protein